MKEPSSSEKQGKTKSKRGGKKQGITNAECDDGDAQSNRIDESAGTDNVGVCGAEGEVRTAQHSEEESNRKKSRSEES